MANNNLIPTICGKDTIHIPELDICNGNRSLGATRSVQTEEQETDDESD